MAMRNDLFADVTFGKLALMKLAPTDANFRLYKAEWLGDGRKRQLMAITGAVFRESCRGATKGQLTIKVPKTSLTVHITAREMAEFEAIDKQSSEGYGLGYMQARGAS